MQVIDPAASLLGRSKPLDSAAARHEGSRHGNAGVRPYGSGRLPRCSRHHREQAVAWLRRDLDPCEQAVEASVKVDLSDNQFGALTMFTFNAGIGAFVLHVW
jgi:GH24 family phage-related lysozyme (muramidase)